MLHRPAPEITELRMKPTVVEQGLPPAGVGGGSGPEKVRQVFAVFDLAGCKGFTETGAIQALSASIPGVVALHVDVARGKLLVIYDGSVATIKQLDQALCTLGAKGNFGVVHQNDRPMPSSAP